MAVCENQKPSLAYYLNSTSVRAEVKNAWNSFSKPAKFYFLTATVLRGVRGGAVR